MDFQKGLFRDAILLPPANDKDTDPVDDLATAYTDYFRTITPMRITHFLLTLQALLFVLLYFTARDDLLAAPYAGDK